MSISQISICKTTTWSSPSGRYVPEENRLNIQHVKCLLNCWWHFRHSFWLMGRERDEILEEVIWICKKANLKRNKDKCLFLCKRILFFVETNIVARCESQTQVKSKCKQTCLLPKMKKLGILNYLNKFSPATAEVCEPLHKLISVKTD